MGRRRVPMKKITNEEARQVCFSKRREGLFKKATELSLLCGAEIAIVVFSTAGKAYSFGHPSVDCVAGRFLQGTLKRYRCPSNIFKSDRLADDYESQQGTLLSRLEAERKRKEALGKMEKVAKGGNWEKDVEQLSLDELLQLRGAVNGVREKVKKRIEELSNQASSSAALELKIGSSSYAPMIPVEIDFCGPLGSS